MPPVVPAPACLTVALWGCLALAPVAAGAADEGVGSDSLVPTRTVPPPARGVRQLSDSELSCAQIYAETRVLETAALEQQNEVRQAEAAMEGIQSTLMDEAHSVRGGGAGAAVGASLLGLIPGASVLQGHAMQAAAEARRAGMQQNMQRMVLAQQRLMAAEQALEHGQARSEHLTDLFLRKGCRLSEVKAAEAAP